MKKLKYIISFIFIGLLIGCSEDENNTDFINDLEAPSDLSVLFKITQDNTGNVTIRPNGQNTTEYEVFLGDGTSENVILSPGQEVTHKYAEGEYAVKIIGKNLSGKTSEITKNLTVSFLPPTDLEVTITTGSNLSANVSAKANLETYFEVYFGENENETPSEIIEGEVATHNYSNPGIYQIKVVALSGGSATLEETFTVNITNLIPAPTPTFAAGNVISLFSNAYTNVPVDTWKTDWSQSGFEQTDINGDDVLKYFDLGFVGAETVSNQINATSMTHFYLNVFSSDFTEFKVKLVDFGADGNFGGGDDAEHELTFSDLAIDTWNTLNIPLSDFTNLTTRSHISQIIFVGAPFGSTTVYIDNVLFYTEEEMPENAAPAPVLPQNNVISLFSDTYTNVFVDTWKTDWSAAQFSQISINGNDVLKYSSLDFVGIETVTNMIDATEMTHFHVDVWSSNFTAFKVKLVDFGANGVWGGGDDVEHEIVFSAPAQGEWISLDIPLSDFTGLTTRAHIAQLIFAGLPTGESTVYIDNVYFHN